MALTTRNTNFILWYNRTEWSKYIILQSIFILVLQTNRTCLLGVSSVLNFPICSAYNLEAYMGVSRLVQACLHTYQLLFPPLFSFYLCKPIWSEPEEYFLCLFFFSYNQNCIGNLFHVLVIVRDLVLFFFHIQVCIISLLVSFFPYILKLIKP